jgi:hypothetical protein
MLDSNCALIPDKRSCCVVLADASCVISITPPDTVNTVPNKRTCSKYAKHRIVRFVDFALVRGERYFAESTGLFLLFVSSMSSKGATKKRRIASNKGVEQQRPTGVSVECDNASDKKTTFQEVSGIVNLPLNIKRTICTLCRRKDAARLMAVCKFWSLAWAQCEFTVMHDVDDLDSVERDWYQQYERLESAGTLTWVRRVVWKVWTRYDHLTKSLVPQRRKAMAIFSSLIHVEELSVLQSGFEIEHWVTVMSAWPRLRSCELQCQDDTESAKLLAGIGAISPLLFDHLDVRAPRASESF